MPPEQLKQWIDSADVVLAADGGADRLLAVNFVPKTTLGDLDSISPAASQAQNRLIRDDDQNSTDCDKLLAFAESEGYGAITLAGVEGDLLDHVIGTIHSAAKSPLIVRLALRRGIGMFFQGPSEHRVKAVLQGRISVIPLEPCEGVSLSGTRWPLENAVLEPFGLTSLSNVSEGSEIVLKIRSGRAFVFAETNRDPIWGRP
jgi:thiamine pyrophosphokinase